MGYRYFYGETFNCFTVEQLTQWTWVTESGTTFSGGLWKDETKAFIAICGCYGSVVLCDEAKQGQHWKAKCKQWFGKNSWLVVDQWILEAERRTCPVYHLQFWRAFRRTISPLNWQLLYFLGVQNFADSSLELGRFYSDCSGHRGLALVNAWRGGWIP